MTVKGKYSEKIVITDLPFALEKEEVLALVREVLASRQLREHHDFELLHFMPPQTTFEPFFFLYIYIYIHLFHITLYYFMLFLCLYHA